MNDEPTLPAPPDPTRKLSGAELREQLKEQYKRELLARKQWLEQAKEASKTAKLAGALDKVQQLANLADTDDTDEWVRRLNEVSALSEAKLELSLDSPVPPKEDSPPTTTKSLGDEERSPTPTPEPPETIPPPSPNKTLGDEAV